MKIQTNIKVGGVELNRNETTGCRARMTKTMLILVLPLLLAFAVTTPAQAAVVTNISVPISLTVFIPCAGESVTLTGDLHVLISVEADNAGGLHVDVQFQPEGVSGTGSVTGDKYQGTGVTRFSFNVKAPFPFEFTFVNNFRIIGQGTGNNFLVHATNHLTIDANGTVTATVDNFSADCK